MMPSLSAQHAMFQNNFFLVTGSLLQVPGLSSAVCPNLYDTFTGYM